MAVDLDDLRAFLAVATAGSISRGAVRLHRTQPAVSERITRLERHLGTTLFTRTRRGIALTPGGHRLLPYAERCLALIEEAVTAVRADNPRGRVRAVMHATFAPAFVPLVLDSLAPLDLEVACDDAHSEDVVRLLADGAADIGFVYPCPHPHEVTVEPFLHDPFVCVATPDHPLAARRRLHVRDLADGPVAVNAWGDGAKEFLALLRAALIPATRLHPVYPPRPPPHWPAAAATSACSPAQRSTTTLPAAPSSSFRSSTSRIRSCRSPSPTGPGTQAPGTSAPSEAGSCRRRVHATPAPAPRRRPGGGRPPPTSSCTWWGRLMPGMDPAAAR